MNQPLPSYLRTRRRKWALTQSELAELLGERSRSVVSKYETLERTPNHEALLALEFVFEETARSLFPALSHEVRRTVLRNAVALREKLAEKSDARSLRKRKLLDALIIRLTEHHDELP